MSGYLIYHPKRILSLFDARKVYHDTIGGNQDPYIWHKHFLHTYCHITQMSPKVGDINFWVSGNNTFPSFTELYCDLIFVVEHKIYWYEANAINRDDLIVDNDNAFQDHYRWFFQHPFKRRKRFTLKATRYTSFQPQDKDGQLLNIIPLLEEFGSSIELLQKGLRAGFNSKPMQLGPTAESLYTKISEIASVKLYGDELEEIRNDNAQLESK